jgi:1,4-dihydroxy-2-naphthoyl-CoA hydrolase
MWKTPFTLDDLNSIGRESASEHCGIRFVAFGEDWLEATIPFDSRTISADGSLHPGSLALLAETIGSVAANLCVDPASRMCVGQALQVNHPVRLTAGPIRARAVSMSILDDTQVWEIRMTAGAGTTVCTATLTMAVLNRR